jgi:hypothetical protein
MKKKLNVEQVTNELRGGSAFFPSYNKPSSPITPEDAGQQNRTEKTGTQKVEPPIPKQDAPKVAKTPQSTHDTLIPRLHDTTTP